MLRLSFVILCLIHAVVPALRADVPLPPNVTQPGSVAEAWNVIRLSRANVSRLIQEQRLSEVAEQVALCSPALRKLAASDLPEDKRASLNEETSRAFRQVNSVAQSAMMQSQTDAEKNLAELLAALTALEAFFDPQEVASEIHYCPNHPDFIATTVGAVCRKCETPLRLRRIPYSFIYTEPTTPTVVLRVAPGGTALVAGQSAEYPMTLHSTDGKPLSPADLMMVHAKPIHLYVADAALEDFQIIHPEAGATPGDYHFRFTPSKSGPHRLWADVVPASTGLQELPQADLGGALKPLLVAPPEDVLTASVDGFHFQISFSAANERRALPRKIQLLSLMVTDITGQPVRRLEPVMQAFAHLVGIYDDFKTVLRVHPAGGEILGEEMRGGPGLNFKLYPPRAGYIRFHCQVRIDGKTITAPFGVHVTP